MGLGANRTRVFIVFLAPARTTAVMLQSSYPRFARPVLARNFNSRKMAAFDGQKLEWLMLPYPRSVRTNRYATKCIFIPRRPAYRVAGGRFSAGGGLFGFTG